MSEDERILALEVAVAKIAADLQRIADILARVVCRLATLERKGP